VAEQLGLFGDAPRSSKELVGAEIPEEVKGLGQRLGRGVHLGTSSWSFPGWRGLLWGEEYSEQVLARRGLATYARHPLLRTVGIDRTHYAPIDAAAYAGYAAVVPEGFRFLAKAHEACTLAVYPSHPRYGASRGQVNPLFFDAAYARDHVVAPFVEGLGATAGPLVFQLAQQPIETLGGTPRRFAEKLYRFLRELPRGPLYAVEVRNAQLLTADYRAALKAAGVVHCINSIPQMPPPLSQPLPEVAARQEAGGVGGGGLHGGAGAALVIRWLLAPQHTYEGAREAFFPFNQLLEPDVSVRRQVAQLVRAAERRGIPVWVIANNKAEGSAPLTLLELARELDAGRCDDVPF
jgi:uncharacterized protein YecE (DUF72 family)